MHNYQKIYLISDIHGYIEGIETIESKLTKDEPLFILGDLFNCKYGGEKQLLDKVCNLISEGKCYFALGNHDEVLFMMFFNFAEDTVTLQELTHDKFGVVTESLKGMFSVDFHTEYEKIQDNLRDYQGELSEAVKEYYDAVTKLCMDPKYLPIYNQIKHLYAVVADYYKVKVGDQELILCHSGIPDNCEAIDIIKQDYAPLADHMLIMMGHLSTKYLEEFLKRVPNSLPYTCFTNTYQNNLIDIRGNYLYNTHSNAIIIDDGSYTNVVTISSVK